MLSPAGLAAVQPPCVLQQFHDHAGRFFKVYVIGDEVMVFERPSLPDLCRLVHDAIPHPLSRPCALRSSLSFDSRYAYPETGDFLLPSDMGRGDGNAGWMSEGSIGGSFEARVKERAPKPHAMSPLVGGSGKHMPSHGPGPPPQIHYATASAHCDTAITSSICEDGFSISDGGAHGAAPEAAKAAAVPGLSQGNPVCRLRSRTSLTPCFL